MADWVRRASKFLGSRGTLLALNAYPPYVAAGIRIVEVAPDASKIVVQMGLYGWNRNFFGTHFGGSLYSMCDPFFLFQVLMNLGDDYVVWDKSATVRFMKPGSGTVRAQFDMPASKIEELRSLAAGGLKVEPTFTVQVRDETGDVVAEVEKVLYIRLKRR
ncbi:MAG: tetrameric acyl-CoA thioesterase [Myxococcaceae bacterium]|nr:tetrameric acyl-CoA thioesterase [Myxococcaceae bacterium]